MTHSPVEDGVVRESLSLNGKVALHNRPKAWLKQPKESRPNRAPGNEAAVSASQSIISVGHIL